MHYELCDFLMDIFQNAVESGAGQIELRLDQEEDCLDCCVADNGKGMAEEVIRQAMNPFYSDGQKHPGRSLGLGLPFLVQLLDSTGGEFSLDSTPGVGTTVRFRFNLANIDTPPMGDLVFTMVQMMSFPGDHEFVLHRSNSTRGVAYRVSRRELHEALGGMDDPEALGLAEAFFKSQEEIDG
ncbi:ATP-binding protein [Spirochaeta lutea]|uniref:ATP-binding protein n=1 Tax=Spirochaeta lutea TaxID=1480694 RepID=UPI000565FD99|nr:ATP-binding protein [Spirochaeta lutea]